MKRLNKKRTLFIGWLILLLAVSAVGCSLFQPTDEADTTLLTINGRAVDEKEGRLYLEVTRRGYERLGGEEIWDIPLNGRDSTKMAAENALDSLIRTKIMAREYDATRLTDQDRRLIERGAIRAKEQLGDDFLDTLSITENDLLNYVEESYRAYRYERSMTFLAGSMEDELNEKVAEAFIAYEVMDQAVYLQKVRLDVIMIYTGEWIDGSWVSYPASQQEEKREKAETAQRLVDEGYTFERIREWYTEDENLMDCPLLSTGVIVAEGDDPIAYRGQIQENVSDVIFKTPAGSGTGIIETAYGYMIVDVQSFRGPNYRDGLSYDAQLEEAREQYRTSLMREWSEEQLESEYERLLADADVEIHDDVWERILKEEDEL